MHELRTTWTINDVADANAVLDAIEDARAQAQRRADAKAGAK